MFKLEYSRDLTAERLWDLRKEGKLSLAKLSEGIEEKTGIYISATQLQKYEDTEKTDIMNVRNLVAIADFYDVSYDYLLGYSTTTKRKYFSAAEKTGLSEKAIKKLEAWNESIEIKNSNETIKNTKAPEELNKIIESKGLYRLIAYIRSLKYINNEGETVIKNRILGPAKVNALKAEIGTNETREYIMFLITNTLRDIINEIVPFTPVDDETRTATQADMDDF